MLDVAYGVGYYSLQISKAGAREFYGIDISTPSIEIASYCGASKPGSLGQNSAPV